MRKFSILLSIMVLAAMVLAACGGEETATNLPSTQVPDVTVEATETMAETATEAAIEEATGTPGVPVTGEINPARLSNQLDFTVWSQDGEQIGEVDDMVLDLENTRVAYVVVGTGGFLDLGDRTILVPWDCLQLQTGTGDTTGGQQNAFILQTDLDTFRNAPDFDLTANLPEMGQPAGDWDADIRNWCEAGATITTTTPAAQGTDTAGQATATSGTGTGQATAPAATSGGGTGTGQATATSTTGAGQATATSATGAGQATATTGAGAGLATATSATAGQATAPAGTDTAGQGANALQGVVLATEVLGATVNLSVEGTGIGTGQATAPAATSGAGTGTGQATATSATGAGQATATTGAGASLATATSSGAGQGTAVAGATTAATATTGTGGTGAGTDQGPTTATIEDMIVDTDAGEILYIVLNVAFTDAERWIPVPLGMFQWDAGMQGFVLNVDAAMLQDAPFFEDGQFPDTTTSGWNSEFDAFWQSSGGSGSIAATATPTP